MIGVFVKYNDVIHKLDLFQDETIQISSSQQNVNDISKVFTDYSQTFTVPATPNNNKVFKHWYENSIQDGFDDSAKLYCYIEINGNLFRKGYLKLEKANIVNGVCRDYSVGFFGSLISLKDKFKDDKLNILTNLNELLGFNYNEENVIDLVVNENDEDIAFPLISPKRTWDYGVNTAPSNQQSTDISTLEGSVSYKELFPSVRVKRILDAIADKYSIKFIGEFLDDKRFRELFLYCKNSETLKIQTALNEVAFTSISGNSRGNFEILNNNSIKYYGTIDSGDIYQKIDLSIQVPDNTKYSIEVYKDGILYLKNSFTTSTGLNIFTSPEETGIFTFKFSTENANETIFRIITYEENESWVESFNILAGFASSGDLDIAVQMPDIKIADFFSGILKMFNLTCYSEDGVDFIIQPLEDWYDDGGLIDITKFCETSYEVNRINAYKQITFKYEKSESVVNFGFREAFQREYGDLEWKREGENKDGEEYKVELPFENLMHQKLSGTKLHVGYTITKDYKPYTPKPILLYKWGNISEDCNFYLEDVQRTSYNAFGQDLKNTDDEIYTLNFRAENSTLLNGVVENTLYSVYYQNYLDDLFFTASRKINIKGIFNTALITSLKLNDRVIIRDKKYKINNAEINLNKNTFTLELITEI